MNKPTLDELVHGQECLRQDCNHREDFTLDEIVCGIVEQLEDTDTCGKTNHNFTPPVKDGFSMRTICTKCGESRIL